jgi:hypothetical protein
MKKMKHFYNRTSTAAKRKFPFLFSNGSAWGRSEYNHHSTLKQKLISITSNKMSSLNHHVILQRA